MPAEATSPDTLASERRAALRALPWVFLSFFCVVVGMTLTYLVMRAVMEIGGSCASGGPYVSARPCPDVAWLLPVGIVGGMVAGLVYITTKPARAPRFTALLWPALFLSLGWNFLEFGLNPPGRPGFDWGWLVCAIVFGLMGSAPLFGLVAMAPRGFPRWLFWGVVEPAPPIAPAASPAPQPGPAGPDVFPEEPGGDVVSALERLARLRASGALSEREFEAAKQRVLAAGGRR